MCLETQICGSNGESIKTRDPQAAAKKAKTEEEEGFTDSNDME